MRGKIFYGTMGGGSASSGSIFLQPSGGGPISGTLQNISDNAGNATTLGLSSTSASIGRSGAAGSLLFISDISGSAIAGIGSISGTARLRISGNDIDIVDNSTGVVISNGSIVTKNGALTIKSLGSNIFSGRNLSNIEVFAIDSSGNAIGNSLTSVTNVNLGGTSAIIFQARAAIQAPASDIIRLSQAATGEFNRLILGQNDSTGISIVKNTTEMRCMLGNGLTYAAFRALSFQSEKLSSGSLADSYPFRVGDIGAITDAGLLALGLNRQLAIENKGQICYIPFSSSLIP